MQKTITAAALLVLGGCATQTATLVYAPPTDGLDAYARVAIRNASPQALYATLWGDALTCSAPKIVLPGKAPLATGETVVIHARRGEPLTINAIYFYPRGGSQQDPCYAITTFVPAAASYVVTYDLDATDRPICSAAWAEGDEASARPVPRERVASREFKVAFGQDGPWCRGLTEAQRAGLGVSVVPANAPAPQSPPPLR